MYPAASPRAPLAPAGLPATPPDLARPAARRLSSVMPPLGALPTAAGAARAHVRTVLESWGVVSELVANAVNASAGPDGRPLYVDGQMPVVWLRLFIDGTTLRAEVWDEAPGVPRRRATGDDDESGRGLDQVVDALSAEWGWFGARSGKCVWAQFRT